MASTLLRTFSVTGFYRVNLKPAEPIKPDENPMPDALFWGIGFTMCHSDIGKDDRAAFRAECFLASQARAGSRRCGGSSS